MGTDGRAVRLALGDVLLGRSPQPATQPQNAQCVGRAWANSPSGPFVAESTPFTCGTDGVGGALDPQLFTDPGGQNFLLVAFGDTETPLRSIPLNGNADAIGERPSCSRASTRGSTTSSRTRR